MEVLVREVGIKIAIFVAVITLCAFITSNKLFRAWIIFRKKKSVKVECWFCQASTTVPPGNANCFDCPECDQYNGFTKDGGYNKPIPAQYSEEMNQAYSRPGSKQDDAERRPSPFCDVCQTHQELKIQQLAAFVPSHESNFDVEVKQYSDYLEEAYRLCPACSDNIYRQIHEQDSLISSKLLGQRLHQAATTNTQALMDKHTNERSVVLCRSLAIVAAALVVISQLSQILTNDSLSSSKREDTSFLKKVLLQCAVMENGRMSISLTGLVCGVLSSLLAGKYRLRHLDCVCPLLWIIYMGSHSTATSASPLLASLPWIPSDVIPTMLSTVVLVSCVKHFRRSREKQAKKVFTNRRLRSQHNTPQQHEVEPEPNVLPQPSEPSSSSCAASINQSLLSSESGEIKRILLDHDIGGLSLGPPLLSRTRNQDVWTAHTPPTSRPATPISEEPRPSSREFRPIISPATFNPSGMKRSASQTSFVSSFSGNFVDGGPFQDQRVSSSRENLTDSGRGRSPPIFNDDSSDGSLPLGMSAKGTQLQSALNNKTTVSGWTSCLLPGILGFSLGINCAAALYFMYGR